MLNRSTIRDIINRIDVWLLESEEMNAIRTEEGEIDTSPGQRPYWGDGRHELLEWLNKLTYTE